VAARVSAPPGVQGHGRRRRHETSTRKPSSSSAAPPTAFRMAAAPASISPRTSSGGLVSATAAAVAGAVPGPACAAPSPPVGPVAGAGTPAPRVGAVALTHPVRREQDAPYLREGRHLHRDHTAVTEMPGGVITFMDRFGGQGCRIEGIGPLVQFGAFTSLLH